jgi:hypothetical protein
MYGIMNIKKNMHDNMKCNISIRDLLKIPISYL